MIAMLFQYMLESSGQHTEHLPISQVGLSFQDRFLFFLLRSIVFPLLPIASMVHLEIILLAIMEQDKYFYKSILILLVQWNLSLESDNAFL